MATEALVTEGHVEVVKDVGKESFHDPNSIEGKDEEKITVEDSAAGESSAIKLVKADEDELKNQVDATDSPETPKQLTEAFADDSEKTLIKKSESETAIEPAVPEAASDEVNTTLEVLDNAAETVDSVSIAENPIIKSIEGIFKPEDKVEEKIQEKALEGEKATLVETSRDVDVEDEKNKADIETEGESARLEGPAKSSHSKNIFSKVMQSIVKVKKAIIGKAPSSKTIASEGTNEIKVN